MEYPVSFWSVCVTKNSELSHMEIYTDDQEGYEVSQTYPGLLAKLYPLPSEDTHAFRVRVMDAVKDFRDGRIPYKEIVPF